MNPTLPTPRDLLESFAEIRLPAKTDARLQWLMDRNSAGQLESHERDELESLAELGEDLSLFRARTLVVLGRQPA